MPTVSCRISSGKWRPAPDLVKWTGTVDSKRLLANLERVQEFGAIQDWKKLTMPRVERIADDIFHSRYIPVPKIFRNFHTSSLLLAEPSPASAQ